MGHNHFSYVEKEDCVPGNKMVCFPPSSSFAFTMMNHVVAPIIHSMVTYTVQSQTDC
ncbi:hypothetical protein BJX66DRAFT_314446 [Aspergillus keveii]|uniref:Uncharacterized protein n=1 Tax=Aspergillus keveii TaxID=714993 RepID=A0ABR4FQT3_9EURO